MARIDAEMRAFIESDVDNMIATRNARMEPHIGRAWGARVAENGESIEAFIDRAHSQDALADLRENGLLAISWSQPTTNKTIQLKGRCIEMGDPAPADFAWIDRHRKLFTDCLKSIGFPPDMVRAIWSNHVVRVRLLVEQAFDQTPGPHAGRPL
jgi:hypothetical protein